MCTDLVQGWWSLGYPDVGARGLEYPDIELVRIQAKSTGKHVCVLGVRGGIDTIEWRYYDLKRSLTVSLFIVFYYQSAIYS